MSDEAAAQDGADNRDAEAPAAAQDDDEARPARRKRSRGSRGGRRRRGHDEDEAPEGEATDSGEATAASAENDSAEDEGEESPAPRRAKRTRSKSTTRRRRGADEDELAESAAAPAEARDTDTDEGDDEDGETAKPRRKRSRGGRGRKKKTSGDRDDADEGAAEPAEAPRAATNDEEDDDEEAQRKRRRRGSRGGRKRKKTSTRDEAPRAAVVEMIPGEEDDLPELPELPDEAELLSADDLDGEGSGRGRKKKRTRRKRGTSAGADEDEDAEVVEKRVRKRKEVVPDRQILVNAIDPAETRVAVVRDGTILDFQMTVDHDQSLVNDIYRGRIVNIEASIGAAFVDFGRGRNGFLHTSDVLPTYGEGEMSLSQILTTSIDPEDWDSGSSQPSVTAELDDDEDDDENAADDDDDDEGKGSRRGGRRGAKGAKGRGRQAKGRQPRYRARPRRPMSELFKVGQQVVVQITKDAIGDKGPTLTTYLSIPGRYLVLMPSISHRGVSRKIEDAKERKRLKKILDGVEIPGGMGIIARTASMGHTKAEIKRDLDYLLGAWNRLAKRLDGGRGPTALYQESDVAIRTVRDLFGPETEAIIVDEPEALKNIREFAELLMPEQADRIKEHDGKRPLFHEMGVEQDFEKIFTRRIELPSGGSIVFDQAEALVAIDVNSGKTRTSSHDFEEIALKTNMEAVPEIARQIRLRDLGGIIVVDFIDMMKNSNRRAVETAFRVCFAEDRARSKMGRISQFGLLEMTRQRLGPGMSKKLFRPCTYCRGAGRARTDSSRAAAIVRRLGSALSLKGFTKVEVRAHPETIDYLKRVRSAELHALEESSGRTLELVPVTEQVEDSVLRYLRADGREVRPGGRRKR